MKRLSDEGICLRRPGLGNHRAPCPRCNRGDRDEALSVTLQSDGHWVAHCFRCDWRTAGNEREDGPRAIRPAPATTGPEPCISPRWRAFWASCVDLRGTPGELYLAHRSCVLPPPDSDLRFHPAAPHWPSDTKCPALVAMATDAESGAPKTLHLTFIRDDGEGKASIHPPRLLLPNHAKAGAVVRLWPNDAVERTLGIAEGIESALSLAHAGIPVWAAIDAGNLARLPVLAGIEELVVAVDRDPAGETAAHLLARRWSGAGCTVRLVLPKAGDLNDVAQGTYDHAE